MGQASSSNQMMAAGMAAQGIGTAATAYAQSRAMEEQGKYQEGQAKFNARIAELQAKDAIERGDKEALSHKKRIKQMVGSQRAAMAAQGIEVNDDDALAIQEETTMIGAADARSIKNNAWREAWGYRVQALDSRSQGAWASMAARNSAQNTLVTGGLQAVGWGAKSYNYYKQDKNKG